MNDLTHREAGKRGNTLFDSGYYALSICVYRHYRVKNNSPAFSRLFLVVLLRGEFRMPSNTRFCCFFVLLLCTSVFPIRGFFAPSAPISLFFALLVSGRVRFQMNYTKEAVNMKKTLNIESIVKENIAPNTSVENYKYIVICEIKTRICRVGFCPNFFTEIA